MTKDTGDFRQFHSVACREYTLHRDDESSQPRGWIQGNTRIGPVLEVTTSYTYGKHAIEIRIWSVGQDSSHSWVRISYGTNKYVVDSNYNNTEVPADLPEEQASQSSVKVIAARSNAKAKPQKREPVDVPSIIPMNERKWIDIEPSELSLSAYEVSKKVIHLLRHNQTVQREEDGAIQFWRIRFHLQNQFSQISCWSDERWKVCLAAGGRSKRRYQYCSDDSGRILYLRALQGYSGNNLIDPTLQDNVIIQRGLFHEIYHIGCAFNLHSIINNGLIPGGHDSSRRQTVFILPIDPRDKDHEYPEHINFSVPRRARYVHSAWKRHQDAVFWVDIDLAIRKGLTFYQTRSNAIILQGTLPAYCTPKVVRLKTGEVLYEKSYMSPRPPTKISLRHDHDWTKKNDELGSTVEQQPVGKLVQQSCGEVQQATFSQLTQPKPKPICDRSGTEDVFVVKGETYLSHEIDEKKVCTKNLLLQIDRRNLINCLKTPVLSKLTMEQGNLLSKTAQVHTVKEQFAPEENRDIASFNTDNEFNRAINEENIDFNIPRVPHSAVKRSHGVNVRNLIQKIENHPHRRALQSDLQQHRQFNPFSKESRDVIKAAGNIELCELLDVEPKAQCKVCLSYRDVGIVYCTCGHFLRDGTEENKKFVKYTLDLFSIPNYYIKKGRPHGHRYGKKPGDHEYFIANSLKKKCRKRDFLGIHDRFIRDERFRKNMIELGRSEETCREMDKLANEDHTHHITPE